MPDAEPVTVSLSDRLETSRRTFMDAIAGLDEEGFRARPASGEWTAAELMSHLLATERFLMGWLPKALEGRIKMMPLTDDDRREHARLAQRLPVPQVLHGLLAQRRDTLRRLGGLSPQQLARPLSHSRRGELTVGWLFQHIAEHEEEHTAQVRAVRARTGRNPQSASAL